MDNIQSADWYRSFLKQQVKPGDLCIDATMGNGNDTLLLKSHENLRAYAEPESISCIVFNLGYLPSGDHAIATKPDSTIIAVEQGLSLLKKGGLMTICIYSGGDSGFDERDAVLDYLKKLNPKKYLVIVSEYYNRPKNPPIPVLIIRL